MSKPVTIIMIEDDEGHARLIERNIRRSGVNNEIVPFTNGTAAINYLFGPRVTYRSHGSLTPFAHVLFGGQHFGVSGGGTANSFAMALGGGADYRMTEHLALRLIEVDYLYTHFAGTRQNDARIEAGISYRWGGR